VVSGPADRSRLEKVTQAIYEQVDKTTGRALNLPREIATYAIGDVEDTLGARVKYYHNGNRDEMIGDWVTTAYRRVGDYIDRGK